MTTLDSYRPKDSDKVTVFEKLTESFEFFIGLLVGNITRNLRRNVSVLILFSLFCHKNLE